MNENDNADRRNHWWKDRKCGDKVYGHSNVLNSI